MSESDSNEGAVSKLSRESSTPGVVRSPDSDPELKAISLIVDALEQLDPGARARVIQYVFGRLGLSNLPIATSPLLGPANAPSPMTVTGTATQPTDIRTLKEVKSPRSVNEMVAVMGFYLGEVARPGERKGEFGQEDLKRYFKHAGFPLPSSPSMALVHAKNAGYIDQGSSRGLYRLNPVGYNLVAHSLPGSKPRESSPTRARRRNRKPGSEAKRKRAGSPRS